jgi:hypothetical protein
MCAYTAGTVIAFASLKNQVDVAVIVRWFETGVAAAYRWGYDGCYDVKLFQRPEGSSHSPSQWILAPAIRITASSSSSSSSSVPIKFKVIPIFRQDVVTNFPEYAMERQICQNLFSGGGSIDNFVISNFNAKSTTKKMTAADLASCDWESMCGPLNGLLASMAWTDYRNLMQKPTNGDGSSGSAGGREESKEESVLNEEKEDPAAGMKVASAAGSTTVSLTEEEAMLRKILQARFNCIRSLNYSLMNSLDMVDLTSQNTLLEGTIPHLIASGRRFILSIAKNGIIMDAIRSSGQAGSKSTLTLARFAIPRRIANGEVDTDGRWTTFGQVKIFV